jgi:hypothetical protein
LCDRDFLGHLGRHFDGNSAEGTDAGFAFDHFLFGGLVRCKNAHVLHDGFGSSQRTAIAAAALDGLRQDKIDIIAGEHEAGNAGACRNRDGNGAHAWAKRRRKEATITRLRPDCLWSPVRQL